MVSKPEFDKLTKREFNKYWRPFFMEMTDEELYTIIFWVIAEVEVSALPGWPVNCHRANFPALQWIRVPIDARPPR